MDRVWELTFLDSNGHHINAICIPNKEVSGDVSLLRCSQISMITNASAGFNQKQFALYIVWKKILIEWNASLLLILLVQTWTGRCVSAVTKDARQKSTERCPKASLIEQFTYITDENDHSCLDSPNTWILRYVQFHCRCMVRIIHCNDFKSQKERMEYHSNTLFSILL